MILPTCRRLTDLLIFYLRKFFFNLYGLRITSDSDLHEDSTWGNSHILKFFPVWSLRGLTSLALEGTCFWHLDKIGLDLENLLQLFQSPNLSRLIREVQHI